MCLCDNVNIWLFHLSMYNLSLAEYMSTTHSYTLTHMCTSSSPVYIDSNEINLGIWMNGTSAARCMFDQVLPSVTRYTTVTLWSQSVGATVHTVVTLVILHARLPAHMPEKTAGIVDLYVYGRNVLYWISSYLRIAMSNNMYHLAKHTAS